jgi:hypothetical protein
MVHDIRMSGVELVELAVQHIPNESNGDVADGALNFIGAAMKRVPGGNVKDNLYHQMFQMMLEKIRQCADEDETKYYTKFIWGTLNSMEDVNVAI